jgi:hypothetical protein
MRPRGASLHKHYNPGGAASRRPGGRRDVSLILRGCPRCAGAVEALADGELTCIHCGWLGQRCPACRAAVLAVTPTLIRCERAGCGWQWPVPRPRQEPNFRGHRRRGRAPRPAADSAGV